MPDVPISILLHPNARNIPYATWKSTRFLIINPVTSKFNYFLYILLLIDVVVCVNNNEYNELWHEFCTCVNNVFSVSFFKPFTRTYRHTLVRFVHANICKFLKTIPCVFVEFLRIPNANELERLTHRIMIDNSRSPQQ